LRFATGLRHPLPAETQQAPRAALSSRGLRTPRARRQIKSSDGRLGGLALANIAIALNLVTLIYIPVVIVPSFWKAMQTW
jgi:hypothetical protein